MDRKIKLLNSESHDLMKKIETAKKKIFFWPLLLCYIWYSAGCSSQTDKFHLCIKVNTMNHTKEDRELVFSCSTTWKPAPTIAWNISDGVTLSDQLQTVTVKNSDHKFNTSSNITRKVSPDWSGHSDCGLNFLTMAERKDMMLLCLPDEKEKKGGGRRERYAWVILWYCVYV